ncbi:hypothetical protein [Streptomyces sp. IBSBF 2507]|uniref:hypothetical protein n=1 Tax=Streptomyces sp. IBSBF 2507 TaxID=2903530 RepID=UPI00351E093D
MNSAAGVILAALEQGRVPAGIALALESAGLLMTPETADDMAATSADAVRVAERSVEELKREHAESARLRTELAEVVDEVARFGLYGPATVVAKAIVKRASELVTENARLRERIAELEAGPALPWAQAMSDHDLHGFLDQLLSAAIGRWQHSPEVPDRVTLAEIEKVCALWRTPGEGNRLDGSEFDGAVVKLVPQARTEPEQGACTECGDGPSKWCVGCAKCSCEPEHDKGCVKASAPR